MMGLSTSGRHYWLAYVTKITDCAPRSMVTYFRSGAIPPAPLSEPAKYPAPTLPSRASRGGFREGAERRLRPMASTEQLNALMAETGAILELAQVVGFEEGGWALEVDDDTLLFIDHETDQNRI